MSVKLPSLLSEEIYDPSEDMSFHFSIFRKEKFFTNVDSVSSLETFLVRPLPKWLENLDSQDPQNLGCPLCFASWYFSVELCCSNDMNLGSNPGTFIY